mgnify:CR=1 FL=1
MAWSGRILGRGGAGRGWHLHQVREFQLRYKVGFQVSDQKGGMYIAPSEIYLTRDVSFNDAQILAKESEKAALQLAAAKKGADWKSVDPAKLEAALLKHVK